MARTLAIAAHLAAAGALLGPADCACAQTGRPQPVPAQPAAPAAAGPVTVDEVVQLAVSRNPRLARASLAIDAAQGRFTQAGLYPNPVFAFQADELGDRTGPPGILSPQVSQEIVRGGKLKLSQAVAAKEVDQAALALMSERFALVGGVRSAFYDAYALQQRVAILGELVRLAGAGVETAERLFEAKQVARLEVVQLEVERERLRADLEAADRELPAAFRRLAAVAGEPRLTPRPLAAVFDAPPDYDLERVRETVMAVHPEVRSAKVAVDRAQFALRRAQADPTPNVTVNSGYTRQSQNRSNDWQLGVSLPLPVFNRNQGNIRAAQAELGSAIQDVARVQNDLADRSAVAFRTYASARQRAERYRTSIIPKANETYELAVQAFKGGQFEYLRVLQAQRTAAEARQVYNQSLGEAWRAAAELSGLLLEESWPPSPAAPSPAAPEPNKLPVPRPAADE